MKRNRHAENIGNQTNVFVESINMETQTVYNANGSINIYPCDFELGKHIVRGASVASQKGRMTTDDDGSSHFRPYAVGSGSRYMRLFDTEHGELKTSQKNVIVRLTLPKKLGKGLIEKLLKEEIDQIKAYVKSRRTETKW